MRSPAEPWLTIAGPRHIGIRADENERRAAQRPLLEVKNFQWYGAGVRRPGDRFSRSAAARRQEREPVTQLVVERPAAVEPRMRQQRTRNRGARVPGGRLARRGVTANDDR